MKRMLCCCAAALLLCQHVGAVTSTPRVDYILSPSFTPTGDRFGSTLTIGDGWLVASAPRSSRLWGAVYAYRLDDPSISFRLDDPDNPDGSRGDLGFGADLDADGSILAISSARLPGAGDEGGVDIFDLSTQQPLASLASTGAVSNSSVRTGFGGSVAISGRYVAVGAQNEDEGRDDSGAVYVFDWTTGQQLYRLTEPNAPTSDDQRFGSSVDLAGDQLIVGASGSNKAYLFDAATGALQHTINGPGGSNLFGYSVGLSNSRALVGAPWFDQGGVLNSGALFSYDRATGGDREILGFNPLESRDELGRDLDIHGDLVLAVLQGESSVDGDNTSAVLFNAESGAQLALFDPDAGSFAGDIALGDGRVALSDPFWDGESGRAFIFTVPEPTTLTLLGLAGVLLSRRRRASVVFDREARP